MLAHRQRPIDEFQDLYDFLMIESLLKHHPTIDKLIRS
jgi:hypothetical protein